MKKELQADIKRLGIAIWVIVAYLVISHLAFAISIMGISKQLENMF